MIPTPNLPAPENFMKPDEILPSTYGEGRISGPNFVTKDTAWSLLDKFLRVVDVILSIRATGASIIAKLILSLKKSRLVDSAANIWVVPWLCPMKVTDSTLVCPKTYSNNAGWSKSAIS